MAHMVERLSMCCVGLTSTKLMERRKSIELLNELLSCKFLMDKLKEDNENTWGDVLKSVQKFLEMEALYVVEQEKKKEISASYLHKTKRHAETFIEVVHAANQDTVRLNGKLLTEYVYTSLSSIAMRKLFSSSYISILKDCILSEKLYWHQITSEQWQKILILLKELIQNPVEEIDKIKYINCFRLLIKYGPQYKMQGIDLRQQFCFVKQVVKNLYKLPVNQQEAVLMLLIEFCKQTAKDCRVACCKLGEDTFVDIKTIYEPNMLGKVKLQMMEYLLLQVNLHHPYGAVEGTPSAYAVSWPHWKECLNVLYKMIICCELSNDHRNIKHPSTIAVLNGGCVELHSTFLNLAVEVFRQVFSNGGLYTVTAISDDDDTSQYVSSSKRRKILSTIRDIISTVGTSREWTWMNVLTCMLDRYPDLITSYEFTDLLQILSELQVNCKDPYVNGHLYLCLSTLTDIQEKVCLDQSNKDKVSSLWKTVWESTLRAAGLNQNETQCNKLLQKLMDQQRIQQSYEIFHTYLTGVPRITIHSLQTLAVAFRWHGFPAEQSKKDLMELILKTKNKEADSLLSCPITAYILSSLVLKRWPEDVPCDSNNQFKQRRIFEDIEDIHVKVAFDDRLFHQSNVNDLKVKESITAYQIDQSCLVELESSISDFFQQLSDNTCIKRMANTAVLCTNMISYFLKYQSKTIEDITDFPLYLYLVNILNNLSDWLHKFFEHWQTKTKSDLAEFVDMSKLIVIMLSTNIFVPFSLKLRELEPVTDFMTNILLLFEALYTATNRDLQNACVNITLAYSCLSESNELTNSQENFLEAVLTLLLNQEIKECAMVLQILCVIKHYRVGTLSENCLELFLKHIDQIYSKHYMKNDIMLQILDILSYVYEQVKESSLVIKSNAVNLLLPFFTKRMDYGPEYSVAITKCLSVLAKLDPEGSWTKWNKEEIVPHQILEFVCSDYQQVRLTAAKYLVALYETSDSTSLESYERRKALLNKLYVKCQQTFTIHAVAEKENTEALPSDELLLDETVSRTSSVLHTYANLLTTSSIFRGYILNMLIEIVHEKHLNLDSLEKVISLLAQHLNFTDRFTFLHLYLELLVKKWYQRMRTLNGFPYKLTGHKSETHFVVATMPFTVPLMIKEADHAGLERISSLSKIPLPQIIEDHFAVIIAELLPLSTEMGSTSTHFVENIITELRFRDLLISKLDGIIIHLTTNILDNPHISKSLANPDYTLYIPHYTDYITVDDFFKLLNVLQEKMDYSGTPILYCIQKQSKMIHNILLQLIRSVVKHKDINEKIKAFCNWTIIVDLIILQLDNAGSMKKFLIYYIIHNLLNLILNERHSVLQATVCKYLKWFFQQVLPSHTEIFGSDLLVTVINVLIPFVEVDSLTGQESLQLLEWLIVEKIDLIHDTVGILDPFPEVDKFQRINDIYKQVRYEYGTISLEDEIKHFLMPTKKSKIPGCRTEGLNKLKKQLSSKKHELKELYEKLYNVRGFSEDAEKSVLHQLICTLIKLATCTDKKVSFASLKCLGELGPADLTTTVLSTKRIPETKCSPIELLTYHVVMLLIQYIVDQDIEVAEQASTSLCVVMESKEGKLLATFDKDYGLGPIERFYLEPFRPVSKPKGGSAISVVEDHFIAKLNTSEIWCPEVSCSHSVWITNLVCALLETFSETCYLKQLVNVCKVKVEFCELILPPLILLILNTAKKSCIDIISSQIRTFFGNHWTLTTQPYNKNSENILLRQESIQCLLNVIDFVRSHDGQIVSKRNQNDLTLNYLHIAKAAQYCSSHFSVLLYVEIWAQEKLDEIRMNQDLSFLDVNLLDIIYQKEVPHTRQILEDLLKKAYIAIDERDALHGCITSALSNTTSMVEHLKLMGCWQEVLQFSSIQMPVGATPSSDLLDSLKNCGLYHVPLFFQNKLQTPQYECMWRLGQWNIARQDLILEDDFNFEKMRYICLYALHMNDVMMFNKAINAARQSIGDTLRFCSLESCKNFYEPLCMLQSLHELEDFFETRNTGNLQILLMKWNQQTEINRNEFKYVEPVIAQRITMMMDLISTNNDYALKEALTEFHLNLSDLARADGSFNVALRAVGNLLYNHDFNEGVRLKALLQKAQIYWEKGDKFDAHNLLRSMLNNNISDARLKSTALRLYGTWSAELHSHSSQTIIQDYFLQSLQVAKSSSFTEYCDFPETYITLAKFADKEYQQILTHIKSSVFQRMVKNMEKSQKKASMLKKLTSRNMDETRALMSHAKHSQIDEHKIKHTYKEKDVYVQFAIKYYLLNMERSDTHNIICIFRIFSLWLENRSNIEILKLMNTYLDKIPTYKFISILPQLVPHITSKGDDEFGQQIKNILKRCAKDHPHHTLPLLLALVNASKDRDYCSSATHTDCNENRVQGVKDLLNELSREDAILDNVLKQMNSVADALIQLAYYEPQGKDGRRDGHSCNIPRILKITKLKDMDNILLPTYNLTVRKNCDYSNIVGMQSFSADYMPLDGINAPKRIKCRGTDGIWRTQLVKGKDDMRQDAVMQQVFTIMNGLLSANKQTSRLLIRTYKIVPLSMRSGILEWVENSMPIGEYLVGDGNSGAHHKYNKLGSYSPSKCRSKIKAVAKASVETKLQAFKDVCEHLQPVFHKFFETSFTQPCIWYERRRAYMHSVATSSMCGYILGIGDRHVRNILLDKSTAEVIHIDFGIAFEQGLILPTPETVPFRLTRDIEDGMGICGIEGVFRRSCEKTMEVLRSNSQTIITILEVLLYDPLYSWTVSSAEAYSRQRDDEDSSYTDGCSDDDNIPVNVSAERALLRLRDKLMGREDGSASSVEGQVHRLIQQARDPNNLCRLFNGWQAYL